MTREFRAAMVGDSDLLERVLSDEEIFLHISPSLYFEILLRRAYHDLETISYTEEIEGRASIPVFDTAEARDLMERAGAWLEYMASMMASFTRIQSYTVPVRVRRGIRRRVRYNDMDIDSLVKFAADADPGAEVRVLQADSGRVPVPVGGVPGEREAGVRADGGRRGYPDDWKP